MPLQNIDLLGEKEQNRLCESDLVEWLQTLNLKQFTTI